MSWLPLWLSPHPSLFQIQPLISQDSGLGETPHGLRLSPACRGLYSPRTYPDGSAASPANTGLAWLALEGEGLRGTAQKCTALPKWHAAGAGAPRPGDRSEFTHTSTFPHLQPCS